MKAIVFGSGEMGEEAIKELYLHGGLEEILVATRREAKARAVFSRLSGKKTRLKCEEVDLDENHDLSSLIKGHDVAVNCIGPNYKYEVPIARGAIGAGVSLVDLNDDYGTTHQMLELDLEARRAGILIILGLGASPGINNILVRAAADQLDEVEEVHTAWVMSGSDPGGRALSYHLLYSLSDKAWTVQEGQMVEVQSFVDGRELIEFPPPVGPLEVFHIGHPEPITLFRSFPQARLIDDKATFKPAFVNQLIVGLGAMARQAGAPLRVGGKNWEPMDFAAECLHTICKGLSGVGKDGALRVEVKGRKNRKSRRVFFSTAGRIAEGTGIPIAIGAELIMKGRIQHRGVRAPEECIEPQSFLTEVLKRNIGKLNGWIEES